MPPRKRAQRKPGEENLKTARGGTSRSTPTWSSSGIQEKHLDHYAEFVNMPVGILVGFLVPNALCADWRMMTKDQRLMLLVLFVATMVSAVFTFIFSASVIRDHHSRSAASARSSSASMTWDAQKHSRFLYQFMYLSFMFVLFLTCIQSPTLRKALYPKLVFTLAVAGIIFALFPPTAKHYNKWISSSPPSLHILRHVAIAIVLFGFSSSMTRTSMREIRVAVIGSFKRLTNSVKKLRRSELRRTVWKW